jgi:hypothetical protein
VSRGEKKRGERNPTPSLPPSMGTKSDPKITIPKGK